MKQRETEKTAFSMKGGNDSALETEADFTLRCPKRSGASLLFWDQLLRDGGQLERTEVTLHFPVSGERGEKSLHGIGWHPYGSPQKF